MAVVLSLVVAVPVLAFKSGTYSGTTSQTDTGGTPEALQLKVNKKKTKVNIVFFELEAPPCDGSHLSYAGERTAVRASGKFKWESEFGYGFVKGQFQHNEAEGTARWQGGACDSGLITWTADRTGP
jgi:hypothetical protein